MLFNSIGVHYKFYGVGFCRKNTLFCFERSPHCISKAIKCWTVFTV